MFSSSKARKKYKVNSIVKNENIHASCGGVCALNSTFCYNYQNFSVFSMLYSLIYKFKAVFYYIYSMSVKLQSNISKV